jgi:hypothetical protein
MLEIILLIFLCRNIGITAGRKGLKPSTWKIYTVVSWLIFECFGAIIGISLFGFTRENMFAVMLFAAACAFGGYLLVKYILDQKPDQLDDIDRIGSNDLRP